MKVAHSYNEVDKAGELESGSFRIQASAHAFQILSSGLYSNKVKAVLRELSCNAYDAHVSAGNVDVPFEVKLPNSLDKSFYVKDFGIGLDHEQVMNLYTTYFSSTKGDSDDFVGAFGLGSKSPFSYTDSFTVVANKDGISRIYTAYIGEDGNPVISLLQESEAPADWQNGVSVSFAVSPSDFNKFKDEAEAVFRWFKVKPHVIGATLTYKHREAFIEGSNFRVVEDDSYSSCGYLTMGNVAYPLNNFKPDNHNLRNLINSHLEITVPIGTVAVAASREEVAYDKRTIANLNGIFGKMQDEIRDIVRKKAEVGSTEWEKKTNFHTWLRTAPLWFRNSLGGILDIDPSDPLMALVKDQYGTVPTQKHHILSIFYYRKDKTSRGNTRVLSCQFVNGKAQGGGTSSLAGSGLPYVPSPVFLLGDSKRTKEIARWLVTTGVTESVVLFNKSFKEVTDKDFKEEAEEVISALGDPVVENTSAYVNQVPRKAPVKGGSATKTATLTKARYLAWRDSRPWEADLATHSITDSKGRRFYVDGAGFEMEAPNGKASISSMWRLFGSINNLRAKKFLDMPEGIYFINSRQKKHIENDPNWVNLWDVLKETLQDKAFIAKVKGFNLSTMSSGYYSHGLVEKMLYLLKNEATKWAKVKAHIEGTRLLEYIEKVSGFYDHKMKEEANEWQNFLNYYGQANYSFKAEAEKISKETVITSHEAGDFLFKMYPLAQYIDWNDLLGYQYNDEAIKEVSEYFKTRDTKALESLS